MDRANHTSLDLSEARAALGVAPDATAEQIRAAYLEQVRQHPPDRDPDTFERVRDAYDRLRDPLVQARQILEGPDPDAPLTQLFEGLKTPRRFIGTAAWLEVLKEKRS